MDDDATIPAARAEHRFNGVDESQFISSDPSSDDASALEQYTKDKLSVTHQVRLLENFFRSRQNDDRASQCHGLMVKLAEDRFTLAVVGQFKRGKSSLMNALIGRELLPTGVLPLTSAITILRFGPREQIVISWENSDFQREESISALADYVTERGNPGNQKKVQAVYIEAASPFLRRGLEFVDTPGIGSAIEANTATTLAFIPSCDAVVFVTGVDAPMTGAELDFLRQLRRDVGKVFCVVNKIDLVAEPQRSEVIGFVTSQIHNCLGTSQVQVFAVSSRIALAADGNGHNVGSGIPELQDALGRFLSTDRTSILLRIIIERSLRLLAAEQSEISLAQRAAAAPANVRQSQVAQIRSQFEAIQHAISERAEALNSKLRAAVVDRGMPELNEHLRLGVAGLAEGLVLQIASGQWESTRKFMAVVATSIKDAAKSELNNWLAGRKQAGVSEILGISRDLRETTLHLLRGVEAAGWTFNDSKRALCEADIPITETKPVELRVEAKPWMPIPTRPLRYLPVSMVCRRLRRWLRPCVEAYVDEVKVLALSKLDDFLATQVRKTVAAITTFVRQEEDRLIGAFSLGDEAKSAQPNALLGKQAARAAQIESALLSLLQSITGEAHLISQATPTESREPDSNAFLFDSTVGRVTSQEVLRDLHNGGCPICRRLSRVLFDFFAIWQHHMAADDAAQRQYAKELGFCPLHTWQLSSISSPRGLSVGYPRLVERLNIELRSVARRDGSADAVRRLAAGANDCRACRMLASIQDDYAQKLAETLGSDIGRRAYGLSRGVCLKHLPTLLALLSDTANRRLLIEEAAAHLEMLAEDMQSFALKQEATRRDLVNSNERTAIRIAVEKVVGVKSLCFPWEFDEIS
jgi:tRNA U34 5-carboxymethylaminomethyl modifying GTPase MnmE/TrmE